MPYRNYTAFIATSHRRDALRFCAAAPPNENRSLSCGFAATSAVSTNEIATFIATHYVRYRRIKIAPKFARRRSAIFTALHRNFASPIVIKSH